MSFSITCLTREKLDVQQFFLISVYLIIYFKVIFNYFNYCTSNLLLEVVDTCSKMCCLYISLILQNVEKAQSNLLLLLFAIKMYFIPFFSRITSVSFSSLYISPSLSWCAPVVIVDVHLDCSPVVNIFDLFTPVSGFKWSNLLSWLITYQAITPVWNSLSQSWSWSGGKVTGLWIKWFAIQSPVASLWQELRKVSWGSLHFQLSTEMHQTC